MYYIELINESLTKDFEKLTFTEFRPLLNQVGINPQVVAFGAFSYPAQPIGLILGELTKEGSLQIHTIFVKPKFRQLGVATALVKELEKAAVANNCSSISLGLIDNNSFYDIFKKLMDRCNWPLPPETEMLLYALDMEGLVEEDAPLFTLMELPEGFTVNSWQELTPEEIEEIKKGQDIWYPRLTSPFLEEYRVDKFNSVFLRDQGGKIIGWTIIHRLDSETMLYRNVFVKEEFRAMGYAMLLMGNAIWRQYDRGIFKLMFCVHVKNKAMNKIVNRFMKSLNYTVKKKVLFCKFFA